MSRVESVQTVEGIPLRIPAVPAVRALLEARSVAVFGASDRTSLHAASLGNLTRARGIAVWGVNPRRREALGIPCVPSAADLPEAPDVAFLLVGDGAVEQTTREALAAGARILVVPGLNAGAPQLPLARRVAATAAAADALLIGPNCMGMVVPGGVSAWCGTIPPELRAGGTALALQSGAVSEAITALAGRYGIRVIVSLGFEAAFDAAAAVAGLAADARTRVIGLFLETVRRPEALLEAVRAAVAAGKDVVGLKVGRSAAAAAIARAHTGADVGSPEAFEAYARSAGMMLCDDLGHFLETLALLDVEQRPRGRRVAAVTNSGGEAALLADAAAATGVAFPEPDPGLAAELRAASPDGLSGCNPLDAWCNRDPLAAFRRALDAFAQSGRYDLLVGQVDQTPFIGERERENGSHLVQALREACARHGVPGVVLSGTPSEPVEEIVEPAAADGLALLRDVRHGLRAIATVAAAEALPDEPAPRLEPFAPLASAPPGAVADDLAAAALAHWGLRAAEAADAEPALRCVVERDPVYGPHLALSAPTEPGVQRALAPLGDAAAGRLCSPLGATDDRLPAVVALLSAVLIATPRLRRLEADVRADGSVTWTLTADA